jgi:hypothetical protein
MVQRVGCSPERFLEFVMDIERYAEVDQKIRPVVWARREYTPAPLVEFACRPKLAGMRQPKVVQQLRLNRPARRIDVSLSPAPHNQLARAMAEFSASFVCEPVGDGTEVTRTLRFALRPWVRWAMEPLLRRRLLGEVREELRLAKEHLEGTDRTP